MEMIPIKRLIDENGQQFYPITNMAAVRDEQGRSILDFLGQIAPVSAIETSEDGFFFVDESLCVGAYINSTGIHSPSIIGFEIVNE